MPKRPPIFRPVGYQSYSQQRVDDPRHLALYTKRWARASRLFKTEHALCLGCQAIGRVEATAVTDHIVPHKGDERLFWDKTNWQPCCRPHHDVVKQRLEQMHGQGRASNDDLRLDSPLARQLTLELLERGGH